MFYLMVFDVDIDVIYYGQTGGTSETIMSFDGLTYERTGKWMDDGMIGDRVG